MFGFIILSVVIVLIIKCIIKAARKSLLNEILCALQLENIDSLLPEYDDRITVKSKQALNNYSDIKYFNDNGAFEKVCYALKRKQQIKDKILSFISGNDFSTRAQYKYVLKLLEKYCQSADAFRIRVSYSSPSGKSNLSGTLSISPSRTEELSAHPEYLMSKGEYNKLLKQQSKAALEAKKHSLYDRVNSIIDFANTAKDNLVVKSQEKAIDDLVEKIFDRTVNNIQKITSTANDEWGMLESFISTIDNQIRKIVQDDAKISDYYASEEFFKIKETCNLLTQSQKDFNEYITEKALSISKLFGTRVVRNETENEDIYNFIRVYKKSITPFTAEVSSTEVVSLNWTRRGYILDK